MWLKADGIRKSCANSSLYFSRPDELHTFSLPISDSTPRLTEAQLLRETGGSPEDTRVDTRDKVEGVQALFLESNRGLRVPVASQQGSQAGELSQTTSSKATYYLPRLHMRTCEMRASADTYTKE